MRITKIEPQKKRPGRSNIYADGKFLAGVGRETLLRLALRTGDEIGPDVLKILLQTEELLSARNAALRFLAVRPRTVREVRDKLREREFGDEEIAQAIDSLAKSGLLNDAEFARMYIRDAMTVRPAGRLLIRRKLLLLGVDKATTDAALDEAFRDVDQRDAALNAATAFLKKARPRGKGKLEVMEARNRLSGFLFRRGYTWETIEPVLRTLLKDPADHE